MIELGIYCVIHLVLTWVFWHRLTDAEGKGAAVFPVQALVLALVGLVSVIGVYAPHWLVAENRWVQATLLSSIPEELFKCGAALLVIRWLDVRSKSAKVSVIVYMAIAFGTFESMLYLMGVGANSFGRLMPTIMHTVCGMIVAEGVVVKWNRFNRHPAVGLGIAMLIHAAHNALAGGVGALLLLLWMNWLFALGVILLFANGVGYLLFSRVEAEADFASKSMLQVSPYRGNVPLSVDSIGQNQRVASDEGGEQVVFGRLTSHSTLIAALRQSGWLRTCHVCQSDVATGPSGVFPCPGCDYEFQVSASPRSSATESAAFLALLLNHGVLLLGFEFEHHLRKVMERPTARACNELRSIIASGRNDAARLAIRIDGHIYNAIDLSSMEFHVYPKEQPAFDAFVLSGMLTAIAGSSVQALLDEGARRRKVGKRFLVLAFVLAAGVGVWQIQRSGVFDGMSMTPAPQRSTFAPAEWPGGIVASRAFLVSWTKHYSKGVSLSLPGMTFARWQELRSVRKDCQRRGYSNQQIYNVLVYSPKYALSEKAAGILAGTNSEMTLSLDIDARGNVISATVKSDLPWVICSKARDAAFEMSGLWTPAVEDGVPVQSSVVISIRLDLGQDGWDFQW